MSDTPTLLPVTPSTDLPLGTTFVFFTIFLIIIIGLAIWIFIMYEDLNTQDLTKTQGTLCPVVGCPENASQTINVQLDPNADPNTAQYETINYCSINAPPTSFVQALEICANIIDPPTEATIPTLSATQVTSFAAFYNNYIPTCGYSWKNPPPETTQQNVPQADPVLVALTGCARNLGISNSDITQLTTLCGAACNPNLAQTLIT